MNWGHYCIKARKTSIQTGENGLLFDPTKKYEHFSDEICLE